MLENIELKLDEDSSVADVKLATNFTSCSLDKAVEIRFTSELVDVIKPKTIPEFFHECCEKYKDLPALAYEVTSTQKMEENKLKQQEAVSSTTTTWKNVSYGEYEQHVEQAALLLLHLGVQSRSAVSILAFNCPEWFYLQMGALRIGAVVAGIYTNNSLEAVHHVLETSGATVCLVDDTQQMSKVRAVKSRLSNLKAVIQLNGPFEEFVGHVEGYYRWSDLFGMKFSLTLREELIRREKDVAANECALLIYTSGTVGMPKGVMLSHDNILYSSRSLTKSLINLQPGKETLITYLPLSHIGAQLFDVFLSMENGVLVHFADRNALKSSLVETLVKVRPSLFFGVPRIYEKLQEKIIQNNSSELTKFMMTLARNIIEKYHVDTVGGNPLDTFRYWWSSKLIHKTKTALGLENARTLFIGAAPVAPELKRFFLSLQLPVITAYGLSETSGPVVFNFDNSNLKTVGKAIQGVNVKINNPNDKGEGEICLRGRCNFMGYLNEDTITSDGWILTGDSGYLDEQGNLYINGRIKELIVTAGGENIPPLHIEELIKKELPCVSNAVVIGDQRKYLTVLLTLKTDIDPDTGYPLDSLRPETIDWLKSLDLHYTKLSEIQHIKLPVDLKEFDANTVNLKSDTKVLQALELGMERVNQQALSSAQRVQYLTLLPHDFSIPTNELGPTLKMRRNIVHQKYAKLIEMMYNRIR